MGLATLLHYYDAQDGETRYAVQKVVKHPGKNYMHQTQKIKFRQ